MSLYRTLPPYSRRPWGNWWPAQTHTLSCWLSVCCPALYQYQSRVLPAQLGLSTAYCHHKYAYWGRARFGSFSKREPCDFPDLGCACPSLGESRVTTKGKRGGRCDVPRVTEEPEGSCSCICENQIPRRKLILMAQDYHPSSSGG